MAKLIWGQSGSRIFEGGVDRGVLYRKTGTPVAWNGLTQVSESITNASVTPYYIDGVKYLNKPRRGEHQGTLEAFTYPDEFMACDGTSELDDGLFITQQNREEFSLSYRTRLGNDVSGIDYGYKIHIVYNAIAEPSDKNFQTLSDSSDAQTFSWDFTTRPDIIAGRYPSAHVIIDSKKTQASILNLVETVLYGSDGKAPRLLRIDELISIYENFTGVGWAVNPSTADGLTQLQAAGLDVFGNTSTGLYRVSPASKLDDNGSGLYS